MYGLLGMLFDVADLVHAVRELATGTDIGQNYVSVVGKKRLRKLVAFPRLPRNVEFHHQESNSPVVRASRRNRPH